MKLERVRLLMISLAALALVLLPIGSALQSDVIVIAALLSFILSVFVWRTFYRCPHCRKFLGQFTKNICPHCGQHL